MKRRLYLFLFASFCWVLTSPFLRAGNPEINLYGHLVFSKQTHAPLGIYRFTNGPADNFTSLVPLYAEPNAGAVKAGDLYYVFNISGQGSYGAEYSIYIYDTTNDYTLVTRALTSGAFMTEAQVVAYDPVSKQIYCAYNDPYSGNQLAILNVSNRSRETVASLGYTKFLTLSFDSQGKLYGISNIGILYEINKNNGELRYIGSTGISPDEFQQAATFAQDNDQTLYWAACLSSQGALYAIDVTTAKATLIKSFLQEEEFVSLWAGSAVVQDAAPGAASNLQAEFPNGALSGTFSFQTPSQTHNGQPLSGTLNYTVKVDGQVAATGTAQAGTLVECPITTTQGLHDFGVVLNNEAGNGEEALLADIYIGYDTPEAVQNVLLTKGDSYEELILTWDAPQKGVHNGYFDPDAVRYIVRRMPEDVIVSDDAQSPFKERVTSSQPTRIFYDVIPYVDETSKGVAMSSNKIMIGTPLSIPYQEDFSSNDNVLSFSIEDSNHDGKTWEYMYEDGYMRIYSNDTEKDEWLFTPYIAMESNMEYKLTFDVRSLSPETLEVKIGSDASSTAMSTTLVEEFEIDDYNWNTIECTFSINETHPFFIGFHCNTTDVANALAIYLDNIKIEQCGPITPAKRPLHFAVATECEGQGTLTATWHEPAEPFITDTEVAAGEKINFQASPNTGYKVEKWTLNGNPISEADLTSPTEYSYTTTKEEDTILVYFTKQTFPVTFSAKGNGTITAYVGETAIHSGDHIPYQETVTFVAKPEEEYIIKDWYQDGLAIGLKKDTHEVSVTHPISIEVEFELSENIALVHAEEPQIQIQGNYLLCDGMNRETTVSIYDTSGVLWIRATTEAPIDLTGLPQGPFIVQIGDYTFKAIR